MHVAREYYAVQKCFHHDCATNGFRSCIYHIAGIFLRKKFFTNRQYVRPNGNFGGNIFVALLQQNHAYLTHVMLPSIIRVCFKNKGVVSESYNLESMIPGYPVYKKVWDAVVGETALSARGR